MKFTLSIVAAIAAASQLVAASPTTPVVSRLLKDDMPTG